jgi:hypothetical protein
MTLVTARPGPGLGDARRGPRRCRGGGGRGDQLTAAVGDNRRGLCGARFAAVRDAVFRALVLGRIVEPTSKLDTVRVLGGLGVDPPSRVTFMVAATASCSATTEHRSPRHAFGTRPGPAGLAWPLRRYHPFFETPREAKVRKVGMSRNA